MELNISPEKTILEIQNAFQAAFEYLKLEFYSQPHDDLEGSPNAYKLDASTTLNQASQQSKEGQLHIHSEMLVSALEEAFENVYGLHVQVFRKSGNLWLQTTQTDHWTLAEQNAHGAEMEMPA